VTSTLPGADDAAGATDVVDLVLLEEELDAAAEFVGHLAAAANDFFPVEAQAFNLQTELRGAMRDGVVELGILQQGLGRDATPVQAGAAGAVVLNARDFLPSWEARMAPTYPAGPPPMTMRS